MSEEKQIDIITDLLIDFDEMGFAPTTTVPDPGAYAIEWRNKLTDALQGYRKQSVGEWKAFGLCNPQCSLCHKYNIEKSDFCPNCGAKMKGGE